MTPDFWNGKRVFLTGHTGFKGSWLGLWLTEMGAEVFGFALPAEDPSLFRQARLGDLFDSTEGDIREPDQVSAAIGKARPEVVLHLAAQALVRPAYADPVATFSTNVMGTLNVLEAARQADSVQAFVNVTSDKCYENRELIYGYRESDPMGGHDPYSASKGCAELLTASYRKSFLSGDAPPYLLASARAGNVIGGGDWAQDRIIPDCIRALQDGRKIEVRNPNAVRPWQHVLEPLSGYLALAEKLARNQGAFAEGWNFGPDDTDARPVSWIVENVCRHWGDSASGWSSQPGEHPHEAGYLTLDVTKARRILGWRPRLTLEDALGWTVEWYRRCDEGEDPQVLAKRQIEQFLAIEGGMSGS